MRMDTSNEILVGVAELKVGKSPQVIKTNLGSCVAVCLYSTSAQVGGMLHFMMAKLPEEADLATIKKAKYADSGIAELFHQLKLTYGLSSSDLSAKLFGGAKVLKEVTHNIGYDNEVAAKSILKEYNVPVIASRTGGEKGYKIEFNLGTGKVKCQIFGEETKEF